MQSLWISGDSEQVALHDGSDIVATGKPYDVCLKFRNEKVKIFCSDSIVADTVLRSVNPDDMPKQVALRGFDNNTMQLHGFGWSGGLKLVDGTAILPDTLDSFADLLGVKIPKSPEARVKAWQSMHVSQLKRLERMTQVEPRNTLAGTALASAIPRAWLRGSEHFAKSEVYKFIRQSYFGGRIQMYNSGFSGDAVEYDIKSAYGWSLTQPIPDWQTYEFRPILSRECGWIDATVRVCGPVGALPVRSKTISWQLDYPTETVLRGIWTKRDLQNDNVHIIEVHRQVSGRWSDDLRKPVERWLEMRESTSDAADRATLRGLSVSLAGRLAMRAQSWDLWHCSEGPAPAGSRMLGIDNPWCVYPTVPDHLPFALPTTASYVTANVRAKVWPFVKDGNAIMTNTDSVHFPAGYSDVPQTGKNAGDWSVKHYGKANYRNVHDYFISEKIVQNRLTRLRR